MPTVRNGQVLFRSDESEPHIAVEMTDIDGKTVLIPVYDTFMGFTSRQPFLHLDRGRTQVGRVVVVDSDSGERIASDENGYREWNPEEHNSYADRTMELK